MKDKKKLLQPWKIVNSKSVIETPWFSIKHYSCKTPLGAEVPDYYVHEAPDSVMGVCITPGNKVLIERQYRLPLRGVSWDYPAGSIEPNDKSREDAIIRELREETGYMGKDIEYVFSLAKDPAFSNGKMHVFLVKNAIQVEDPKEERELVTCSLLEPRQILNLIEAGEMSCSFCVATTLRLANQLHWYK